MFKFAKVLALRHANRSAEVVLAYMARMALTNAAETLHPEYRHMMNEQRQTYASRSCKVEYDKDHDISVWNEDANTFEVTCTGQFSRLVVLGVRITSGAIIELADDSLVLVKNIVEVNDATRLHGSIDTDIPRFVTLDNARARYTSYHPKMRRRAPSVRSLLDLGLKRGTQVWLLNRQRFTTWSPGNLYGDNIY
ncbi:MAG: hypothetical protein MHM6MM_004499 [Cercozoa sp. M6MM]